MANFVSMFTGLQGYEEFEKQVQQSHARKRGKYHKHPKIYEYSPYTHISDLYCKIASYLPYPIGTSEEIVTEIYGLRAWFTIDIDETYKEPPLKLFQAEIIGTENFNVQDRIYLHEKLTQLLAQRVSLENAVPLLNKDLQEIKSHYTIGEFVAWLKNIKKQLRG